jgi:uncharacterized phosphosugar-binding protein
VRERIFDYVHAAQATIERIEATQVEALERAAVLCAGCIEKGGLVHLFGSGHSRMAIEEIFPRYGSYPGWHPIVELSLTYHTDVVGSNGQRQAMFLERLEGFGDVILRNFSFGPDDVMMVFSTSGTNGVVLDVALGAKRLGMPVIAVTSVRHSRATTAGHSSGKRLFEVADITLDNCAPPGDSAVQIPGLDAPVGPLSTIGNTVLVNALKCQVAQFLTERGQPPLVLASAHILGKEAAAKRFDDAYDDYRARVRRL